MKKVIIYTDGACSGNPGPGGYAGILMYNGFEKTISGGDENTTNNRMELTAVIAAMKLLKCSPSDAIIYTDSAYIYNCINQKWYEKWKANGWRTANKTPVLNQDLWEEFLNLLNYLQSYNQIEIKKVQSHSGVQLNELADYYAVTAREEGAKLNDQSKT
jgi:ribonuclease HI